ncbi:MAG: TadE/TadG family type IV pilus assembly protein [Labrenzia sp.]
MLKVFIGLVARFRRSQNGAILPIFGLMVIMLVVVGGAAIDVSRVTNAREKLSYAIDAAALSLAVDLSGKIMRDSEIRAALVKSFKANLEESEWRETAIENIDFVIDSNLGTITVSSSAHLANYFIDMGGYGIDQFGPESFNFGTSATVNYSRFELELAMVLDVTGSMNRHMNSLRKAATSVVNILIPDKVTPSSSKVRISLIPYSQGVNLGHLASKVTENQSDSYNCVNERRAWSFTDQPYNAAGNIADQFKGTPDIIYNWNRGKYERKTNWSWQNYRYNCPKNEIVPLTSDKNTLSRAIGFLTDEGGTAGHTGFMWGWYTLAPNYNNIWPIESAAGAYQTGGRDDKIKKAAILMTDGAMNMYFENTKLEGNACAQLFGNAACRNGPVWENRLYNKSSSNWEDQPYVRARRYCDEMKSKEIELFTVYFQTNYSQLAQRLMEYCADSIGHFYFANNQQELELAFERIAKQIQAIYLSK